MEQTPVHSLHNPELGPMNAHASPDDVSGMVDGTLPSARRTIVEAHLAVCADCRAELVSAAAIVGSAPHPRVRRTKWAGAGILAAAAVLAILMVPRAKHRGAESLSSNPTRRGSVAPGIANVVPTSSADVDRDSIRFIWRSEPGASYRLFVTDSAGVPVFTTPTTDTTLTVPDGLRLLPGTGYLWYVEALRPDGSTANTAASSFTIKDR